MGTIEEFESKVEQIINRDYDWRSAPVRKFRWRTLRREWGRYCFIVTPFVGERDLVWWEWENGNGTA